MNVMDIYMKELACGQKIVCEEMLMHQQNINLNNFLPQQPLDYNLFRIITQQQQYFHQQPFSPSSSTNSITNINFPTSSSIFSSLPPNSFATTTSNKPQNFSYNNNQQYPPLFDPFAATVAANFMQHFTHNNQQQQMQLRPSAFINTHINNVSQSKTAKLSPRMASYNNFAFPHFGFSPCPSYASLNSTGNSANDSLSSSGIPSSPDDSSCSLDSEISIINGKNEVSKHLSNKEEKKEEENIKINEKVPIRWVNCKEMFPDEDGIFERLTAERTKIEAKENTKINSKSPTTSLDTLPSSFIPSSPASCSQDEEIIIIETNNINESDNEINIEDCTTKNEKNLTIQKDETILCEKVVTVNNLCENLKIENTTNELDENTKISPSVSSFDCISSSSTKDDSLSLEEHKIELDDQNESNKEETQSNNEDQKSPQKLKNGKIPCRWANCKEVFYDEDGLYDHLTLAHIDVLTKWVIAEQGEIEKQQKNNGIKRRRSSTNLSIENVKERFRCQWRKCEQYPRRGDAQKKIDWLLNHLVFRHAPKSRPHKCLFEGCTLRFSKVGTLRDHIRCTHNEIKNKQNGKKSTEENHTKITCFEFRPCVVHFPFVNDCIDSRTIEWTRNEMTKTKKEQRMIFSNPEREFRRGRKRIKVEIEENTKIKKEIITNEKNIILPRRLSINESIFHLKSLFKRMT